MAKTDYETQASAEAERLIADLFDLGRIGYVALGCGQEVIMRLAPGVESDTTPQSNFYEELLVNPALLKLASQRGELDCGGLYYIAVGYGHFVQLILPMKGGHVSLGISRSAPAGEIATKVQSVLEAHGRWGG